MTICIDLEIIKSNKCKFTKELMVYFYNIHDVMKTVGELKFHEARI